MVEILLYISLFLNIVLILLVCFIAIGQKRLTKTVMDNNPDKIYNHIDNLTQVQNIKLDSIEKLVESKLNSTEKVLENGMAGIANALTIRIEAFEKSVLSQQKMYDEKTLASLLEVDKGLKSMISNSNQINSSLLSTMNETKKALDTSIYRMTTQNKASLDEMREVVDEKLSKTLETRLNKSFEIINTSLTDVNKGLGDMQSLAKDVGGLKNVLQNVKVRGTWAEMQLDNLLSQMLKADQYIKTAKVNPRSQERVDFAVKLPGKEKEVLLPIDAKFPIEEYQRLITATQNGDVVLADKALKNLEIRLKEEAKSISSKYICVPHTTDFAVMYLPLEGLYAEVVRKDGLYEQLIRDFRVMVCGPSTLGAMLSSLQMGFKTVAIEKKSSEIHKLLLVFKREFVKFNELLEKTQKKISEAGATIDDASRKTRTITTKLNKVEEYSHEVLGADAKEIGGYDED